MYNQYGMFPQKQFTDILKKNSTIVTMNQDYQDEKQIPIMITNSALSPNSSYHIHSLEKFSQGDMFTLLEAERYLVRQDTVLKRHSKYKATADWCNYFMDIYRFIPSNSNKWTYTNVKPVANHEYVGRQYGILEEVNQLKIDNNQAINLVHERWTFTIRNTKTNLETFTYNTEFDVMGRKRKVAGINELQNGLLIVTLTV